MLIHAESVTLTLIGRPPLRFGPTVIEIKEGVVRIGKEIFPLAGIEVLTYE